MGTTDVLEWVYKSRSRNADEDGLVAGGVVFIILNEVFKEQDVKVYLGIKGSGYQFISPKGMDDFKVELGVKIKL